MTTMSKLSKTIGKFKLWGILAAVVIVAGIVIAAIFGFNTDAALSDSRTLSVRLDSYVTDDRTALIREVCEEEIGGAGLGDKYSMTSEFSGTGCEIVYAFSSSVDESAVAAVKTAVENRLTEATGTQGNALYGAYVYVTSNAETVSAVLPEGYIWRAVLAGVVAVVLEFIYVAVRYKLNMGIAAAASHPCGDPADAGARRARPHPRHGVRRLRGGVRAAVHDDSLPVRVREDARRFQDGRI